MTIAPEGRKLLRLEVRNASVPIEKKPPWIKTTARTGAAVSRAAGAGEERGPAHGLPGGGLSQHLRVLGGPRGHLPDRWRPVHPALRLLPDRHRQAGGLRRGRAAPGRRVGAEDEPALRDGHRRLPRRPARRGRLAVRRDDPQDPRPEPRHRRGDAGAGLLRPPALSGADLRDPAGGVRAQRRDGAADLQADPSGLPLRPFAAGAAAGPGKPAW